MTQLLYLASQSPRRQALLHQIGIPFELLLPGADEDPEALEATRPGEAPATYVKRVVLAKLEAARALHSKASAAAEVSKQALGKAEGELAGQEQALVRLAGDDSGIMPGTDLRRWLALDDLVLPRVLADGIWRGELDLLADDTGAAVPVEASITAVMASDGRRHCFLVAVHDLRERRLAEERLQRRAMVDELTGRPNRLAQWKHRGRPLEAGRLLRSLWADPASVGHPTV